MSLKEYRGKLVALVTKIAEADLGLTSSTAKIALDEFREQEFVDALKDQLVRDAPVSARRILGEEISVSIFSLLGLPYDVFLTGEQLTQQIADKDLVMMSASAKGALITGKVDQFLEGVIALYKEQPRKSHEFLGDEITVLLNNYIAHSHENQSKEAN